MAKRVYGAAREDAGRSFLYRATPFEFERTSQTLPPTVKPSSGVRVAPTVISSRPARVEVNTTRPTTRR